MGKDTSLVNTRSLNLLFFKNGRGRVCLSALLVFFALSSPASAQIRQTKLFLDDGASLFTILMSPHLSGGNQIITFPNLNGGHADFILSNSIAGQTIDNGLRINGGLSLGTMLAPQYGGTGIDGSTAPNGSILIGNGAGYELNTITGAANQVTVTNGPGTITLGIAQDIAPTSSPTFAGLTLGSNGASPVAGSVTFADGAGPTGHAATITTAPMGENRTITIPDPGANASVVTTEGNQTINGNKTLTGTTSLEMLVGAGTNHFAGTVELAVGQLTAVVPHTGVQLNSTIILTYEDLNNSGMMGQYVKAKNPGVSFTVMLMSPVPDGANARLHYLIVNP